MAAVGKVDGTCGVCKKCVGKSEYGMGCEGFCEKIVLYHISWIRNGKRDYDKFKALGDKSVWYCASCKLDVQKMIRSVTTGVAAVSSSKSAVNQGNSEYPALNIFRLVSNILTWSVCCNGVKLALSRPVGLVRSFKGSTSLVFYGVSVRVLKEVIESFAQPLTYVLNACLAEGTFPDELKSSRVVPVFKKGNRSLVETYRPIATIPAISKVFEAVMKDQLLHLFESNGLFCDCQHFFRKVLNW